MKYIVEVKYTNPAHEHVSLRRRVESVNRIVEARSEAEAINRVANQQRALGFLIKETKIKEAIDPKRYMRPVENQLPAGLDKPKKNPEEAKKEPVKEETVEEDRAMSAAIAGGSVGSKILTGKMDPNFGYAPNKMPPHLKAAQAKSDALSKVVKRPQAGTLAAVHRSMEREMLKKEEIEQTDEARKMSRVEWRIGTESEVDKNNKKIFDKLSKTDPFKAKAFHDNLMRMKKKDIKESVEYIEEELTASDPASKWIHHFVHSKNPKFAGNSKAERINRALGAYYSAKNEEVEQVSEAEKKTNEKDHVGTFNQLAKHNPEKAAAYLSHVSKMQEAEKNEAEKLAKEKANKPETQDDIKLKLNARIPNKYMRNKHVKIHPPFNIMPNVIKRV